MKFQKYYIAILGVLFPFLCFAQIMPEGTITVEVAGEEYSALVDDGDTLILADLQEITYTSPRKFKSDEEYRKYKRYKRYAAKVYPYAVKAIRIFRETEYVTQNMEKKERKKHIKRLQKKLKRDLKDNMKNLTKLQGTILTKMIERELDKSTYKLVASLRGNFVASYWHTLGIFYNYNLKRGYVEGDDRIMDIVLKDFDVSYDIKSKVEKNKKEQEKYLNPSVPQPGRGMQ